VVRLDDGRGVFGTLRLKTDTPSNNVGQVVVGPTSVRIRGTADSVAISGRLAREDVLREANEDGARRPLTAYLSGANRVAGAELRAVDEALGAYFGVSRGVLVLNVSPGTPAQRTGLVPGDVIVRVQGREVGDIEAFRTLLARSPGPVSLQLVRRGRTLDVTLPR
jgi:serine protease Do